MVENSGLISILNKDPAAIVFSGLLPAELPLPLNSGAARRSWIWKSKSDHLQTRDVKTSLAAFIVFHQVQLNVSRSVCQRIFGSRLWQTGTDKDEGCMG